MLKRTPNGDVEHKKANQFQHLKMLKATMAAVLFAAASPPALAAEGTGSKPVEAVQVTTDGATVATYYFYTSTGWGAAGCPGAQWAYIYSDRIGARELLALVMQARQINKTVHFVGDCAGPAYFQVQAARANVN